MVEAQLLFTQVADYARRNGAPRYGLLQRDNLLQPLITAGKLDDASRLAEGAVAEIQALDGPSSPLQESFFHNLIVIEQRRDRPLEAAKWAERLLPLLKSRYGEDSVEYLRMEFARDDHAASSGRKEDEVRLQKFCLSLQEKLRGISDFDTLAQYQSMVINGFFTLVPLGEPGAAISLVDFYMEKLHQTWKAKDRQMPPFYDQLGGLLAVELIRFGEFNRADELLERAHEALARRGITGGKGALAIGKIRVNLMLSKVMEAISSDAEQEALLSKAVELRDLPVVPTRDKSDLSSEEVMYAALEKRERTELALLSAKADLALGKAALARETLLSIGEVPHQEKLSFGVVSAQVALAQGAVPEARAALSGVGLDRPWEQLRVDFNRTDSLQDYFHGILLLTKASAAGGDDSPAKLERARQCYSNSLTELASRWPAEYLLSATYLKELVGIAATIGDARLIAEVLARHKGRKQPARAHESVRRGPPAAPADRETGRATARGAIIIHRPAARRGSKTRLASPAARSGADPPEDARRDRGCDLRPEALQPGSLLADFIQFRTIAANGCFEDQYGVLVTRPGAEPVWRVLTENDKPISARQVDSLVRSVRQNLEKPPHGEAQNDLVKAMMRLYRIVWSPLDAIIGQDLPTEIIVAPDGALAEVPFAALYEQSPEERRTFLCQKSYQVRFIGSANDLVKAFHRPETDRLLVIAAPATDTNTRVGFLSKAPRRRCSSARLRYSAYRPSIRSHRRTRRKRP
jgi:hypothetical protein